MADSEEDISDTDHEQLSVPSPKRAKVIDGQQRKFTGAAAYKSGFQACWQKRWPCIKPVKNLANNLLPLTSMACLTHLDTDLTHFHLSSHSY